MWISCYIRKREFKKVLFCVWFQFLLKELRSLGGKHLPFSNATMFPFNFTFLFTLGREERTFPFSCCVVLCVLVSSARRAVLVFYILSVCKVLLEKMWKWSFTCVSISYQWFFVHFPALNLSFKIIYLDLSIMFWYDIQLN